MDRKQFESFVKYSVQDALIERGMEGSVELREVVKQNDQKLTGLGIRYEEGPCSPCIYLDDMYARYQEGLEIAYIVEEVVELIESAKNPQLDMTLFTEYDSAKEHLAFRLVDIEENKLWLADKVWEGMGDFAKVSYMELEDPTLGQMTAVVTMGNLALMGVDREQILSDTQKNMDQKDYVFVSLTEMMVGMLLENGEMEPEVTTDCPLYVLTNKERTYGAAMLVRPDVLKTIGDRFGCNYYVLPSSQHEVLIVPVDAGLDLQVLSNMVRDVNDSAVHIQDKLSDKVQFYDREKERLRNAYEDPQKEAIHKTPRENSQER